MSAPTPRAWTPADLAFVVDTYHRAACSACSDPRECPGAAECVYAEHLDWAAFAAVLDALAAAGWVNLSHVSGYEIDGELHRPDDVQIWMRPEATDALP